jgi:ribosomal protein S18 acetylase RimI-like enzyme
MDYAVKTATPGEDSVLTGTVVAAFLTDPIARWLLPEAHQYFTTMPGFIKGFAGAAFAHESAYHVGAFAGAALWLPPGIHADEDALVALFRRNLAQDRLEGAFALFEQMGKYHPVEPHWYLPLIGVDPVDQGHGYGSALMKYSLERCDQDKELAYLESSNPRNISLYIRHGFEIIGTIRAADSPPLIAMVRKPQASK